MNIVASAVKTLLEDGEYVHYLLQEELANVFDVPPAGIGEQEAYDLVRKVSYNNAIVHARDPNCHVANKLHAVPPGEVVQFLAQRWPVCIRNILPLYPEVYLDFLRFTRLIRWHGTIDLRIYASQAGSGLDMHFDRTSAFVIQLCGEKAWCFSSAKYNIEESPSGAVMSRPIMPDAEIFRNVTLAPGRVLFIPKGVPHKTTAIKFSLAVNVSFNS